MKILLCALFLSALPFYATAADDDFFRLTLTKGDTVTVFRQEARGRPLVMEQEGRVLSERSLLPDDQAYLEEKIKAVPLGKESGCGRASGRVTGTSLGEAMALACLDRNSKASSAIQELANLLAAFL